MTQRYIHELSNWTGFHWDARELTGALSYTHRHERRLTALLEALPPEVKREIEADALTREALDTSRIEGEILDPDQARWAVAASPGMDAGKPSMPIPAVEGIVRIIVDAARSSANP